MCLLRLHLYETNLSEPTITIVTKQKKQLQVTIQKKYSHI